MVQGERYRLLFYGTRSGLGVPPECVTEMENFVDGLDVDTPANGSMGRDTTRTGKERGRLAQ